MHDDCNPARLAKGVGTGKARPPGSIDWPAVRRDYATGRLSNVELCRKHYLAPTTLSKRIRIDRERNPTTWQRNLSGQIRTTTAALLIQEHTRGIVKAGHETTAVLAAAAATRDVILGHRKDIGSARRVWTGLLAELEATTTSPAQLAAMLAQAGQHLDEAGRAALAAQHAQLMQLHQRVGSIQRLADATIKLQAAERKAFGLKDDDGGSDPLDQMTEAELEAQIATLEAGRVAGGPALKLVS
jgi:hypothetical protein